MRLGWGRGGQDSQKSSEKSLDEFLSERLGKRSQGHYLAHPISSTFCKMRNHRKSRVFWICGKMRESAGICGCYAESVRRMAGSAGKCGKIKENAGNCNITNQ